MRVAPLVAQLYESINYEYYERKLAAVITRHQTLTLGNASYAHAEVSSHGANQPQLPHSQLSMHMHARRAYPEGSKHRFDRLEISTRLEKRIRGRRTTRGLVPERLEGGEEHSSAV